MTHRIVITPSRDSNQAPRHNSRGPLFDVSYNGNIIVTATIEPCLDGARALKAMGVTGRLELWDNVLPYCRLNAEIDKAANLTVREGDRPPSFAKFQSFSRRLTKDGELRSGGTEVALRPKMPRSELPGGFAALSAGGAT